MPKTVELITVKEILEELNISRNHFYLNYKPYVIQIPTMGKELKFDKQSVLEFHKKRMECNITPGPAKIFRADSQTVKSN